MTYNQPNNKGFYGQFGGQFVPETLMTAVKQLEEAYEEMKNNIIPIETESSYIFA